jgi:bacterioferritin-associated ferredoxin
MLYFTNENCYYLYFEFMGDFLMYVCICKAVTDTQIQQAIENGVCTRRQLFHCFGVGGDCGKCNKEIKELLDGGGRRRSIMPKASHQPVLNAC